MWNHPLGGACRSTHCPAATLLEGHLCQFGRLIFFLKRFIYLFTKHMLGAYQCYLHSIYKKKESTMQRASQKCSPGNTSNTSENYLYKAKAGARGLFAEHIDT